MKGLLRSLDCFFLFWFRLTWPSIPSGNVAAPMFYPLLCAAFSNNNRNLAHNHRFLLHRKFKATDERELKEKNLVNLS